MEQHSDPMLPQEQELFNGLWEKVYVDYHDRVQAYAFGILRRKSEAEDVAQSTFVRVRSHLDQLTPNDQRKTSRYILSIARNLSLNQLKQEARETCLPQEGIEDILGFVQSTEEIVMAREERRRIDAALGQLNEDWQMALRLRYIQDYPEQQIADRLGISANLVAVWLCRAKRCLRDYHWEENSKQD